MATATGQWKKDLTRELKRRIVAAGGAGVGVTGGRGTAWGWIEVLGPDGGSFTDAQRNAVRQVTSGEPGGNYWCDELKEVGELLGMPNPEW